MLPLIALPTNVKYRDLSGLQKAAWDAKVKDADFLRDVRQMKSLEDQLRKLASELAKREPVSGIEMVRENDYELLRSWAIERVFLAVRPKGTPRNGQESLIPLEFDSDTNLVGINLKNDPKFKRIDVGIEDNCYYAEANYVSELNECFAFEDLWKDTFDDVVRVVYRFTDGTLFTLYRQYWNESEPEPETIPLDADYETFESEGGDPDDDPRPYAPQLAIYQQFQADEVWIPLGDNIGRTIEPRMDLKYKDNEPNEWHWAPSTSPKRPLMSPVFAMDTKKNTMSAEGEDVSVDDWSNIGLFYYAIEADVLTSIVEEFERVNGVRDRLGKRGRRD